MYVYDSEIDTRGLAYPRALKHLLTGLYFAEVCLIGLFALKHAAGPIALMIALLVTTILVHISLNDAIGPLLANLPKSLATEDQDDISEETEQNVNGSSGNMPIDEDNLPAWAQETSDSEEDVSVTLAPEDNDRAIEGLPAALKATKEELTKLLKSKFNLSTIMSDYTQKLPPWMRFSSRPPQPNTSSIVAEKPNFLLKFLHPEIYSDYTVLRRTLVAPSPEPVYPPAYGRKLEKYIYHSPSFFSEAPSLAIPRDDGGVSRQEVAHSSGVIQMTDEDMSMDERGKLKINLQSIRYLRREDRLRY